MYFFFFFSLFFFSIPLLFILTFLQQGGAIWSTDVLRSDKGWIEGETTAGEVFVHKAYRDVYFLSVVRCTYYISTLLCPFGCFSGFFWILNWLFLAFMILVHCTWGEVHSWYVGFLILWPCLNLKYELNWLNVFF